MYTRTYSLAYGTQTHTRRAHTHWFIIFRFVSLLEPFSSPNYGRLLSQKEKEDAAAKNADAAAAAKKKK